VKTRRGKSSAAVVAAMFMVHGSRLVTIRV
jgi:hypothetical protein